MDSYKRPDLGFVPPPHINAEPHKRVMAWLQKMSPQEALRLSVEAGVHTPDGKLTSNYRPDPEEESEVCQQARQLRQK